MRTKLILTGVLALGLMLGLVSGLALAQGPDQPEGSAPQGAMGAAFTYQGRLEDGSGPFNGACDLKFSLYDAAADGTRIDDTKTLPGVEVRQGLFTVLLNFGAGAFDGQERWLEIEVRCPAGTGDYATLNPRQPLTAVPYALYAASAGGGTGGGDSWSLTGNSGTTPGTNYLGTSDNKALELKVNGQRALRLEPNTESPNVIGGYSGNSVAWGWGATICGGGGSGKVNHVVASYGTVCGGSDNTASGGHATIGGGASNEALGDWSTVGGGHLNIAHNTVATVGGGTNNEAIGWYATVPGGRANIAGGDYSLAAGRRSQANDAGTFVWADSTDADFASTGANQFLVRARGGLRLVSGASTFADTNAALQVENAVNRGEVAWFRQGDASNPHAVLNLVNQKAGSNNLLEGWHESGSRQFHIDNTGAYTAGSDFAEAMPVVGAKIAYEPGDVLVISAQQPGAVEQSTQAYDGTVIGVYSTRPGFLGADKGGDTEVWPNEIPVAVVGIVPVKVSAENGPIRPGDLLTTSSTTGHAMRCEGLEPCFGRTLGKALEGLEAEQSTGLIRMLVTLQ
jgi:hypothetical protein